MATQGPQYPATTASLSNAGTSENSDAWVNPGNIAADDGVEATITAATYDSPDISQLLVASNFGFTIPAGATIDGITVEIDRRSIIASSGKDFRVQLATGTTFASLVGSNKAATATIWPTSSAVASYGGAADDWTAGLTETEVNAAGFAVFLSAQANIANADIGVDLIRVTVAYTAFDSGSVTVTPSVASLTSSSFVPAVILPQLATPGAAGLTLATFDATVTTGGGPTWADWSTTFSNIVTVGVVATPDAATLGLTGFAPGISATDNKTATPGVAVLTTAGPAPVIVVGVAATPATAGLALTSIAPAVVATNHITVTVGLASLSLASFAPTVTAANGLTATIGVRALTLSASAPTATVTDHKLVMPGIVSISLTVFAPTVTRGDNIVITPSVMALNLAPFVPTISAGEPVVVGGIAPIGRAASFVARGIASHFRPSGGASNDKPSSSASNPRPRR